MLLHIILTSLFCIGLHAVTRQGKALHPISVIANSPAFPQTLANPICDCLTCMSSIWGVVAYSYIHLPDKLRYVILIIPIAILLLWIATTVFYYDIVKPSPSTHSIFVNVVFFGLLAVYIYFIVPTALPFIFALAGLNYLADMLITTMNTHIEAKNVEIDNSVNQGQAIDSIIRAIKNKK